MSEWDTRITRFVRDGVMVSVVSYPSCFGDTWQTIFVLNACHIGKDWSDANVQHKKWVKIAELMGYRVFSDEIDGKEKAPETAVTALGAKNNISP